MKILVFRTDIKTDKMLEMVKPVLNNHPVISDWSVDTEDIDNVLRIEASDQLNESEVIDLIKPYGLFCEALPD